MKFLIQTINKKITLDFAFALERNVEYQKWRGEDITVAYAELSELDYGWDSDWIPVGTVEFVQQYMHVYINEDYIMRPKNVPEQLMQFRYGDIMNITLPDDKLELDLNQRWFVKSRDKIKHDLNGFYTADEILNLPAGNFQITSEMNIVSEHRCFVHRNRLLDCRCYAGDFKTPPDWSDVDCMITKYDYPFPYTLDVFVDNKNRTNILEVHDFWSCGLYGFEHPSLAYMFSQAWHKQLVMAKHFAKGK